MGAALTVSHTGLSRVFFGPRPPQPEGLLPSGGWYLLSDMSAGAAVVTLPSSKQEQLWEWALGASHRLPDRLIECVRWAAPTKARCPAASRWVVVAV